MLVARLGHTAELGFEAAAPLLDWLAAFPIERMTGWLDDPENGYCWLQAARYSLRIRDSHGGRDYESVDAAYRESFPELVGLECNSQAVANQLSRSSGQRQRG